jgi:hypothetical protein
MPEWRVSVKRLVPNSPSTSSCKTGRDWTVVVAVPCRTVSGQSGTGQLKSVTSVGVRVFFYVRGNRAIRLH